MRSKLLVFVVGLVVGVLSAVLLPSWLRPYVPKGMLNGGSVGEVAAKGRDEGRLLLTVLTDEGATLATFSEKAAEIALLVEVGDRVTLGLGGYRPFVENPQIWRVEKPGLEAARPAPALQPEAAEESPPVATDVSQPEDPPPQAPPPAA